MTIYNQDGSLSASCGNGTRCVAHYLAARSGAENLRLATSAGPLAVRREGALSYSVDMGPPRLGWRDIPLAHEVEDAGAVELEKFGLPPASCVSMGNPHAIFFVPSIEAFDLAAIGPVLEHDPLFPQRANISLAQVLSRDAIRLRVWERGTGLTLACGTAACATLVAAARAGLTERRATISLPGGDLVIEWRADNHIVMTGPVEVEFSRRLRPKFLRQSSRHARKSRGRHFRLPPQSRQVADHPRPGGQGGESGLVVVNTCAVTAESIRQARQAIRRLKRERPEARIVVTGCAAQIEPQKFAAMPEVAHVMGNAEKTRAVSWSSFARKINVAPVREATRRDNAPGAGSCGDRGPYPRLPRGAKRLRPLLHFLRHPRRARRIALGDPQAALAQARKFVETGHKEIVLTGVDLASWGQDLFGAPKLGGLVRFLLANCRTCRA